MTVQVVASTERIMDATELDDTVSELSRIVRTASVDLSLAVGALIIERFYAGDPEGWRRSDGGTSLRRLAQHPALPMSASALQRCVALYVLTSRVGELQRFTNLGTSHFRAVFGLRAPEQRRLLTKANAERWTVVRLQAAAATERATNGKRPGRPRTPALLKTLRRLRTLTGRELSMSINPSQIAELDAEQMKEVLSMVRHAQLMLSTLQRHMTECAAPASVKSSRSLV